MSDTVLELLKTESHHKVKCVEIYFNGNNGLRNKVIECSDEPGSTLLTLRWNDEWWVHEYDAHGTELEVHNFPVSNIVSIQFTKHVSTERIPGDA